MLPTTEIRMSPTLETMIVPGYHFVAVGGFCLTSDGLRRWLRTGVHGDMCRRAVGDGPKAGGWAGHAALRASCRWSEGNVSPDGW